VKTEGKAKRRGTELEVETTFSDYKDVDGYMEPFSVEQGAKGMPQKQKMTFTKIEMNVPIDDSRFAVPAGADTSKAAPRADAGAAGDTKDGNKKVADAKADTAKSQAKVDANADAGKKPAPKATATKKKKGQ